jgi:hypothetical protein
MHVENQEEWATRVAGKLRLLGASMQDESVTNCRDFFEGEIKQALEAIPSSEKGNYLDVLLSSFPGGESGGEAAIDTVETKGPSIDEMPIQEIVDELVKRAAFLSADERRELVSRLESCGLIVPQQISSSYEELPEELAKRLSLPVGEKINSRNAVLVLSKLVGIILDLDQLVWKVWKTLSPNSRVQRESQSGVSGVVHKLGRYITGDTDVPLADVVQPLDRSRQLTAGLLGAIGPVGSTIARKFAQRFSPDDIRKHVKREGSGFIKILDEVKYWNRYELLAKDLNADQVDREIREEITRYAEALITGRTF